jgi:rhodanese-related sulfurtransferase
MKTTAAIIAFLVLATSGFASESKYADISQEDLTTAIASRSVVILDANGSDSYKAGHIPGAINYWANKDHLASLLPADKNALVVAYCYNPQCPAYAQAAKAAEKLGYTNIKHYRPGITGWVKSGAPVEKGGGD